MPLMMEIQSHSELSEQKLMLPPPPGTFQDREDLIKHVRDFGVNQGYVVTIKKSKRDRRVILGCDRGGVYRNRRKIEESKRKRKASSRLTNCPFEAIGKKDDDVWVLTIKNGEHNHEPLKDMSEHPYSRRFSEEEVRQIKLMTEAGIKPSQVLKALKHSNPDLHSTPRHLYNLKAKIRQGKLSEKSFKSWRPTKSVAVDPLVEASAKHNWPLKVPNLIEGKFVESQASAVIDVTNPATQEVVSQVPLTTYEEFKAAVSAAKQAFVSWKSTPVGARQRIMFKLQELIRRDIDKLAMNIAIEQGKTLNGARGDVLRGLEVVEHACGVATLQIGEFVPNASNNVDTYCVSEPVGVCAGICPLNFPATISLWMFPLAVTCGNTFILKPSEKNPGSSMILSALAMEAGLPDGVLNIVHGTHDIVNHICDDDDIKAISFVDSKTVGMHVYAKAAARGKRVQSNLGAKNYAIIMPDASADVTVDALVSAGFGAAGQGCMTIDTAIFVGGSASWERELVERAKALKVNAGTEAGADLGPVLSKEVKEQICRLVQSGVETGARLVLDGRSIVVPRYERGIFLGPTILCDVTTSMECYKEEMFGPVLLCMQADSLEEAINIVNRNNYGNGASIFTTSGVAARKFQSEVKAALVGINVPVPIPLPFSSFNGSMASFAGDLNFYGKAGVQFYTQIKTVAQQWKDLPSQRVLLPLPLSSVAEIGSQGVFLMQPSTSDSDLPSREVSPTAPSESERDLPRHNVPHSLPSMAGGHIPNPEALSSTPSTTDGESTRQEGSLTMPLSERDSRNQEMSLSIPPATGRNLQDQGTSLSVRQTSEKMYSPQTAHWDGTLSTSQGTNNILPGSERIYMPPTSRRVDNLAPSAKVDTKMPPASDSLYVTTSLRNHCGGTMSFRNENTVQTPRQTDTNIHPSSERAYMPTMFCGNENVGSTSQRTGILPQTNSDCLSMPTSFRNDGVSLMSLRPIHPASEMPSVSYGNDMVSSQRTDASTSEKMYMPSAVQGSDGLSSTSESLYIAATSPMMYAHSPTTVARYPEQGKSYTLPTTKKS